MSWIKQNENSYIHDTAPFSIIKQNEIWYVVDSRDQSKAVPYDDIFNNPVYNIDFSSKSLLAKHFRAEGVNTPGTPGFSFQGDINSGIYRIDEDRIGFSAGGVKQGEFGSGYGGFTGNIIQWITDKTQTSKSVTARAYVDIEKGTGVSWEILLTPKLLNSKIVILFRGAFQISASAGLMGVRILNKVNLGGTYSAIWKPEELNATAPFDPVDVGSGATTAMNKNDYFIHAYHNPTYLIGDVLYYKFQFTPYLVGAVTNNVSRAGNNGETSVSIMEIAQ